MATDEENDKPARVEGYNCRVDKPSILEQKNGFSVEFRKTLKALIFSSCTLQDILYNFDKLEELTFDRCVFDKPNVLINVSLHRTLRKLCLLSCSTTGELVLPKFLASLGELRVLHLSSCQLSGFPEVVTLLSNLEELKLDGNENIKTIPNTLQNLKHLRKLDLSCCGLKRFFNVILQLTALEELRLWNNDDIIELPPSIEQLRNLAVLDASLCGLSCVPDAKTFDSVRTLRRGHNISTLSTLVNLQTLLISTNYKIAYLPESFEQLHNLQTLNVSRCGLRGFPKVVTKLSKLKVLDLSHNQEMQPPNGALLSLKELVLLRLCECDLCEFPEDATRLPALTHLIISGNPGISTLPASIALVDSFHLDVADCGFTEFPRVICSMPGTSFVSLGAVQVLSEELVKFWHDTDFPLHTFVLANGIKMESLVQPPFDIYNKGSEACMDYYHAAHVSNLVNCHLLSVHILGNTEAGKTSLVRTMKEGKSHLTDIEDRTVVVDTVQMKTGQFLLQITDFGGHDIYELTCPLFLRSANETTIIAVKLPEYSDETHDKAVTSWLSTAVSHMRGQEGSIGIVATQADLLEEDEVEERLEKLKDNVTRWRAKEAEYQSKVHDRDMSLEMFSLEFSYYVTSSKSMRGIQDLTGFLMVEAAARKVALPKHWSDVYKNLLSKKSGKKRFLTLQEAHTLFKQSLSFFRKISGSTRRDMEQCLSFLHDTGLLLWYQSKDGLHDIVFHDISFIVKSLQGLFRHNLCDFLSYTEQKHGKFFAMEREFQEALQEFHRTGNLPHELLMCIWSNLNVEDDITEALRDIIIKFELCYADPASALLRFPWFVQEDDSAGNIQQKWSEDTTSDVLIHTVVYEFFDRVPATVYERMCVKLQRHLKAGAHCRTDYRNTVYAAQDEVKVLLQRLTSDTERRIQIQLKSPVRAADRLSSLLLGLCADMQNLCAELPRLVVDAYSLCPHCTLIRSQSPTKRLVKQLTEECTLEVALCGSEEWIPASLVFPALLCECFPWCIFVFP